MHPLLLGTSPFDPFVVDFCSCPQVQVNSSAVESANKRARCAMQNRSDRRPALLTALMTGLTLLLLLWPAPVQAQDEPPVEGTPAAGESFPAYLPIVMQGTGILNLWPQPDTSATSANVNLDWAFVNPLIRQPRFTLYLEAGDTTPDLAAITDQAYAGYDPPTLEAATDYYWQIVATDVVSPFRTAVGDVWHFRTEPAGQSPDLEAMVEVPAGPFLMGCDATNPYEEPCSYNNFHQDEPVHTVYIDAFKLDKYEVTNQEYKRCLDAGICSAPRKRDFIDNSAYALHPVVYVSWWDAVSYCAWEEKRLPTEAEWEKAARGVLDTRKWPWGNEPADCTRFNSNFYRSGDACNLLNPGTVPVGRYWRGASPYGAQDMPGNVFEWVQDKYDVWYYNYTPAANPQGPPFSRAQKTLWSPWEPPPRDELGHPLFTIRGGSWRDSPLYLDVSFRHWGHHGDTPGTDAPYYRNNKVGFRCAR